MVPQRVKNRPALRPSNCTVGDLPQRFRCNEMLGHLHPDVSSSNVHNSQTVEGALVSIERWWIKKLWSMYTMEYSSAIRNDKYTSFASTWMEQEGIMLSEISQSEKDKHYNIITSTFLLRKLVFYPAMLFTYITGVADAVPVVLISILCCFLHSGKLVGPRGSIWLTIDFW